MNKTLVSIMIPNYNGKNFLDRCLRAIFQQTFRNFEVILIDNGSSDGSAAWVKKNFPFVRLVENKKNLGFGAAINRGVANARGEYLLFLNNDIVVTPNFMFPLIACLERNRRMAVVQPKIFLDKSKTIESTGFFFTLSGFFRYKNPGVKDNKGIRTEEVFGVTGAALLIRKEIFEMVRGFDENFFLYSEDADLCWRVRSLGYSVFFVPDSLVYHAQGETSKKLDPSLIVFHSFKNRTYVLLKNLDFKYLLIAVPINIGISLLGTLLFLGRGKVKQAVAILKAIAWNFANINRILKIRRTTLKNKRIKDEKLFKKLKVPISADYLLHFSKEYVKQW